MVNDLFSGRVFVPRFGLCRQVLRFFMAGLLCTSSALSLGSLSHPAGGRPSHPISESVLRSYSHLQPRPEGALWADRFSAVSSRPAGFSVVRPGGLTSGLWTLSAEGLSDVKPGKSGRYT